MKTPFTPEARDVIVNVIFFLFIIVGIVAIVAAFCGVGFFAIQSFQESHPFQGAALFAGMFGIMVCIFGAGHDCGKSDAKDEAALPETDSTVSLNSTTPDEK